MSIYHSHITHTEPKPDRKLLDLAEIKHVESETRTIPVEDNIELFVKTWVSRFGIAPLAPVPPLFSH